MLWSPSWFQEQWTCTYLSRGGSVVPSLCHTAVAELPTDQFPSKPCHYYCCTDRRQLAACSRIRKFFFFLVAISTAAPPLPAPLPPAPCGSFFVQVPLPVPGVCTMSVRAFGERFAACPEPEFALPGVRELPALSFPLTLLLRYCLWRARGAGGCGRLQGRWWRVFVVVVAVEEETMV